MTGNIPKNKRSIGTVILNAPYLLWAAIFIVVPLFIVVYYTFTNEQGAFTLENIKALADYKDTFIVSIWYSVIATVICLVLAYPFAFFMSRAKASTQRMMMMLVMLPMWMNLLIRTYAWMMILENNTGIINSILKSLGLEPVVFLGTGGAVILGMVYNYLPYMILPIYTAITKIDPFLYEAADDLGCNVWQKLRRVVLPLSLPGVISGITMVFVPSISTFYISAKLGNGMIVLIGDTIQRYMGNNSTYNIGSALSLVLMVFIITSMIIMNKFSDDEGGMII